MEIGKAIRQRLTVNAFQAVFSAAAEVWKERKSWKMERLHFWHKALLIIEFNLPFIPRVTFGFHCAVLDNASCQSCSVSSLLFNKSKHLLRPGRSVFLFCRRLMHLSSLLSVFKNPVCKVYRFQTADSKWMLVREQMEECTLSFSIPKQLLSLFIQEDTSRYVTESARFVCCTLLTHFTKANDYLKSAECLQRSKLFSSA